jgi:uncharacterized protein
MDLLSQFQQRGLSPLNEDLLLSEYAQTKSQHNSAESIDISLQTDLVEACSTSDLIGVRSLLKLGAKVDPPGVFGHPLAIAISHEELPIVKELIDAGADINRQSNVQSLYPLEHAILSGNVDILNLLIERGVKVPETMRFQRSILHMSATADDSDTGIITSLIISLIKVAETLSKQDHSISTSTISLLEQVNYKDPEGNTPLLYAAIEGNVGSVKVLVEAGADVNIQNNQGESAILLATNHDNVDIAMLLYNHGASIPKSGVFIDMRYTPISWLSQSPSMLQHLELYLRAGVDMHELNEDGTSVLHVAVAHSNVRAINALVNAGIDFNRLGQAPFLIPPALFSSKDISREILMKLVNLSLPPPPPPPPLSPPSS